MMKNGPKCVKINLQICSDEFMCINCSNFQNDCSLDAIWEDCHPLLLAMANLVLTIRNPLYVAFHIDCTPYA